MDLSDLLPENFLTLTPRLYLQNFNVNFKFRVKTILGQPSIRKDDDEVIAISKSILDNIMNDLMKVFNDKYEIVLTGNILIGTIINNIVYYTKLGYSKDFVYDIIMTRIAMGKIILTIVNNEFPRKFNDYSKTSSGSFYVDSTETSRKYYYFDNVEIKEGIKVTILFFPLKIKFYTRSVVSYPDFIEWVDIPDLLNKKVNSEKDIRIEKISMYFDLIDLWILCQMIENDGYKVPDRTMKALCIIAISTLSATGVNKSMLKFIFRSNNGKVSLLEKMLLTHLPTYDQTSIDGKPIPIQLYKLFSFRKILEDWRILPPILGTNQYGDDISQQVFLNHLLA